MQKLLVVLITFLCVFNSVSQINKDSLWNIWNDNTLDDSLRIKAIDVLAWNGYLFSQPDSAFYLAQLQYDLAKVNNNKLPMARALSIQGSSSYIQSNYLLAIDYYKRSLKIYQSMSNKKGIASIYNNLGSTYETLSNYNKAIDYFQKSLKIKKDINDIKGVAASLGNMGNVYFELGEIEKAIDYLERSLNICEDLNDKQGIAIALENKGVIHAQLGNNKKAQDNFQQALDIYDKIEDNQGKGIALNAIGTIYFELGNYDIALEYYQFALSLFMEVDDKESIAKSYLVIGKIYFERSDYPKASDFFEKGLVLLTEIGNEKEKTELLNEIAKIYRSKGVYDKAIQFYYEALKISEKFNDIRGIALTNRNLGNIYADQHEYAKAIELFNKALTSYEQIQFKKGIAKSKSSLAGIYKEKKEYTKAISYYQESLEVQEDMKELDGMATSLGNLGEIYLKQNKYELAMVHFRKSLELEEQRGNQKCIAICKKNMGNVYRLNENYNKAIELSDEALSIALKVEVPWVIRDAALSLYLSYKSLNNTYKALEMYELYIKNRDLVLKEKDQRELFRYQYKYSYEKQADSLKLEQKRKNDIAQKDADIAKKEAENKNLIIFNGSVVLILIIVFSIIVANRLKTTRKQKQIIEKQKDKNLFLSQKILEQDQQLILGETAKTVAHELNSPLGAIRAGAEGLHYLMEELINNLLPASSKEDLDVASHLSSQQETGTFVGMKQKQEKAKNIQKKLSEKFGLELASSSEIASELSELHVFNPDEKIINFLVSCQDRQPIYELAKCIGQIKMISETTISATNKSADVVSTIREALDFQSAEDFEDIRLHESISSVVTIIETNINQKGTFINDIDTEVYLSSVNEFKTFQLWYNLMVFLVEESEAPMKIHVSSTENEAFTQVQFSLNQSIQSNSLNEHHYNIIMDAKRDSNDLRMGIVKYLLSENHVELKSEISSDQTVFIIDFPAKKA